MEIVQVLKTAQSQNNMAFPKYLKNACTRHSLDCIHLLTTMNERQSAFNLHGHDKYSLTGCSHTTGPALAATTSQWTYTYRTSLETQNPAPCIRAKFQRRLPWELYQHAAEAQKFTSNNNNDNNNNNNNMFDFGAVGPSENWPTELHTMRQAFCKTLPGLP